MRELLAAARERAEELSIAILQTYVADGDNEAMELLQQAGFGEEARLRGRLSDGEEMRDLLVYTVFIEGRQKRRNPRDDYYGQRTAWQEERVERQELQELHR